MQDPPTSRVYATPAGYTQLTGSHVPFTQSTSTASDVVSVRHRAAERASHSSEQYTNLTNQSINFRLRTSPPGNESPTPHRPAKYPILTCGNPVRAPTPTSSILDSELAYPLSDDCTAAGYWQVT